MHVDKLDGTIRVYVELLEIDRWMPVWADRYEFRADELGDHIDAVTAAVVGAVDAELVMGEQGREYRRQLPPAALHQLYVAWESVMAGTPEGYAQAFRLLDAVAREEPGMPEGPAVAAFVSALRVITGASADPAANLARARELANESRARGDLTALADVVDAHVLLWDGSVGEAAELVRRALAARPTCDATFATKASVMRYMGDWEEAVESAQQAIRLAPRPLSWFGTVLASAYYVGERYQDVVDTVEPMVMDGTADLEALLLLTAAQAALGMSRHAKRTAGLVRRLHPGVSVSGGVRRHPFTDPDVADRWLGHLTDASLTDPG